MGNARESCNKDRGAKRTRKRGHRPDHPSGEPDPQIRAENEDDDGYDPYSDRQPQREPLFQRDPWA